MTHSFPTRRSSDLLRQSFGGARNPRALRECPEIVEKSDGYLWCFETRRNLREGSRYRRRAQALRRISGPDRDGSRRSEEHTSELQSLMRISYAVFCLKKKKKQK